MSVLLSCVLHNVAALSSRWMKVSVDLYVLTVPVQVLNAESKFGFPRCIGVSRPRSNFPPMHFHVASNIPIRGR